MRDGVEVAPRIGDDEQIALLKKIERHFDEVERSETEGIPFDTEVTHIEIKYDAKISFKCLCGADVYGSRSFSASDIRDLDPESDYEGCEVTCRKCGSVYKIFNGKAVITK